jgi:SAM-dependent methyltransferase
MFKKLFRKLFPKKKQTDFPEGYIPHKFFTEKINKEPILVIGDYTGKDYNFLKNKFKEVYLLDLVNNNIADKSYFIHQSVTKPLPFPDNKFSYILILEVIEHVWEDKAVLEELNRVMKDDGRLMLSTPFYSDKKEYHYHIYSPRSIKRLLNHSGFKISECNFRGLIMSIPNSVIALLALILYPIFKQKSLEITNRFFYKIHMLLKHSKINKLSKRFGILAITEKVNKVNPEKIQKDKFEI